MFLNDLSDISTCVDQLHYIYIRSAHVGLKVLWLSSFSGLQLLLRVGSSRLLQYMTVEVLFKSYTKCQISWVVNYVAEPAANRFADLCTQLQCIQVPLAIFSVPLEIYTLSMHSMTEKFVGRKKIRIKKAEIPSYTL